MIRIMVGDCLLRMKELDDSSIDSAVTDPPYHLTSIVKRFGAENAAPAKVGKTGAYARASAGFMGQKWDGGDVAFRPETWAEVLRVLKPGAHVVAFSGTRTYHRMACAIEDAGFEIRDQLAWLYGSGFPKSHNQPGGWGTALKPAFEPICLARKPMIGTVAGNIAAHGTGALNIDGCRINPGEPVPGGGGLKGGAATRHEGWRRSSHLENEATAPHALGRWPANIIHDGSEEVLAGFPEAGGGFGKRGGNESLTSYGFAKGSMETVGFGDSGSAARFFYCAKATSEERGEGNNHPTVKPVDLMRWLCRLVTPKGGTVLDPFSGSGSTLIAANSEGFEAIGCELSPDYAEIAKGRLLRLDPMFMEVEVL